MEPALTAAVEPVRHVRGIKSKDINPVCSLSLSPGRSGSDLPGCLWGTPVSPETRSVCLPSRAQKGPSLRRSRAPVHLCFRYPPRSKASARTSAVTITDSRVIKARSSRSQCDSRIDKFFSWNCCSTIGVIWCESCGFSNKWKKNL